jgi:endonuclease YncB( thermonuclease family)
MPKDNFVRGGSLVRIIDGDSFVLALFLGGRNKVKFEPAIRVADYSAPELRHVEGPAYRDHALKLLQGAIAIDTQLFNRMSFERELAYVWVDDQPFDVVMTAAGFPNFKETPVQQLRKMGVAVPAKLDHEPRRAASDGVGYAGSRLT